MIADTTPLSPLPCRLVCKLDFPEMAFSLFFLGYERQEDIPQDPKQRAAWMFSRPGLLELTHNWVGGRGWLAV
jgi:hypothetical protein